MTRDRWEYLTVVASKLDNITLSRLGADGWELTAISDWHDLAYFRRKIAQ